MRIWRDSNGALVDDERVLTAIASAGSLRAAAREFDFELVIESESKSVETGASHPRRTKAKRLADYISE